MTKPALIRPRTIELLLGLVVVVVLGGFVIARSGLRTSSADQPVETARTEAATQRLPAAATPAGVPPATSETADELADAQSEPVDQPW